MSAKSTHSFSTIKHEVVEELDRLPVYFRSPKRDSCAESSCCTLTVPIHWHEYVEFIYMLGDSMTANVQCTCYDLQPGDLLVINSGELHSTKIPKLPSEYVLMQISARRLKEIFPDFDLLHFNNYICAGDMEKAPQLKEMLLALKEIFDKADDGYQLLFTARLYEFLHILYKNYCRRTAPIAADTAAGRDRKRIAEIVEWTQNHYREPLTLEDAAGQLGISREYFCRIFKRYTGQTYLEFLCSTRTMNFYNELRSSDLSIPMLMEENGLTNYKTFIRTFKEMYGTTPQKVRQGIA